MKYLPLVVLSSSLYLAKAHGDSADESANEPTSCWGIPENVMMNMKSVDGNIL